MVKPPISDPAGKRLQMADIARIAGASKATVPRALNHSPLVREAIRDRTLKLASSLKYTPQASLPALVEGCAAESLQLPTELIVRSTASS